MASERDNKRGKGLRKEQDRSFAARVVEKLELRNALMDDATLTKLKIAGLRTQRATTLFLFCRVALPLVFGLRRVLHLRHRPYRRLHRSDPDLRLHPRRLCRLLRAQTST